MSTKFQINGNNNVERNYTVLIQMKNILNVRKCFNIQNLADLNKKRPKKPGKMSHEFACDIIIFKLLLWQRAHACMLKYNFMFIIYSFFCGSFQKKIFICMEFHLFNFLALFKNNFICMELYSVCLFGIHSLHKSWWLMCLTYLPSLPIQWQRC